MICACSALWNVSFYLVETCTHCLRGTDPVLASCPNRRRWWGWCMFGRYVVTRRSWTPAQPGDSWTSPPPARSRSSRRRAGEKADTQTVKNERDARMCLQHLHKLHTYINIWTQSAPMLLCHARDCVCTLSHFRLPRVHMAIHPPLWCRDILPVYDQVIENCASTNMCVLSPALARSVFGFQGGEWIQNTWIHLRMNATKRFNNWLKWYSPFTSGWWLDPRRSVEENGTSHLWLYPLKA